MKRAPGSYAGLTVRQADLLSYLRHEEKAGRSPSYLEMQAALQLSSRSNVNRLVVSLCERGYIERIPHKPRSLRVLQKPLPPRSIPDEDVEELLSRFTMAQLAAEMVRRGESRQ